MALWLSKTRVAQSMSRTYPGENPLTLLPTLKEALKARKPFWRCFPPKSEDDLCYMVGGLFQILGNLTGVVSLFELQVNVPFEFRGNIYQFFLFRRDLLFESLEFERQNHRVFCLVVTAGNRTIPQEKSGLNCATVQGTAR